MSNPTTTENAFRIVSDMEDDVYAVRQFAWCLVMIAEGRANDPDSNTWNAIIRVAYAIVDHADSLLKKRDTLSAELNPHIKAAA